MVNSTGVKCPICMENLKEMVCPRITKCGHVFCWTCMLQYLDYEKQRNWKRCPLCFDSVYRLDLKNVDILQSRQFRAGQTISFDLMVRAKGNTLAKNKRIESEIEEYEQKGKLQCLNFTQIEEQKPYQNTRIRMNT